MSKRCPYCGNNPVPHGLVWFNESLNIVLTPLRQKLLYNPLSRLSAKHAWGQRIALVFLKVGEVLGIISRQDSIKQCKVRRAQVLWEEAQRRGLQISELLLFGKPFDTYTVARGGGLGSRKTTVLIFSGLPRPVGYYNHRLDLMDDKAWFKKFMIEHGLPVARGGSCSSFVQAKKVFKGLGTKGQVLAPSSLPFAPFIVKPRSGSRGRHTTTYVTSEAELKHAFEVAQQLCHWVMVEEQLFGPIYRATVINFELAGVLRGDSPQVSGDGQHTIKELIDIKNFQPHPGVKDIKSAEDTESFLARQKLALLSIPAKGQIVQLSEKIGVSYGGSSAEEFDICHPDNKQLFVQAAKTLGDPIVGFDFIIPDIAQSYKNQKCGFIEVNTLPFINLHHDPLHGKPRNVAAKVWDMLLKDGLQGEP